jgi:uncharacterized Tic20 family protein
MIRLHDSTTSNATTRTEVKAMNDSAPSNSTLPAVPSKDDCNLGMLSHLLGIFTGFIGALILWVIKKDQSAFIGENAKEALNFQITLAIGWVIAMMLTAILIGVLLYPVLFIVNLVFCIIGAIAASKGELYKYPFAIRLVK